MGLDRIRLRIRHFLLQYSKLHSRSLCKNFPQGSSVSAISQELAKKIDLSPRRLQKYLTKDLPPKELSIKLQDLEAMTRLNDSKLGEFIAYLLQEDQGQVASPAQQKFLSAFQGFHEGHRRALAGTIFSGKNQKKSEEIIPIVLALYDLGSEDLNALKIIVNALSEKNKRDLSL